MKRLLASGVIAAFAVLVAAGPASAVPTSESMPGVACGASASGGSVATSDVTGDSWEWDGRDNR